MAWFRASKESAVALARLWLPLLRKPWFIAGLGLAIAVVLAAAPMEGLDFGVYREGAAVLLSSDGGRTIYDPVPLSAGTRGLPFTYPPFAALIFIPFALMPAWLGFALISATSCLCLVVVSAIAVEYLARSGVFGSAPATGVRGVALIAATTLFGLLAPWRESLGFGQINAMLMLLVVLDLVRPQGKVPRGVLIGVAAGIKLTPLVFGLLFLARRDFRSVLAMGLGAAGTAVAAWIVAPNESAKYWFAMLGDAGRIGDPSTMYNLSLNALSYNLGLEGPAQRVVWILMCLLVVVAGYVAIRTLESRGDLFAAITANAIVMLAISPISWGHHWVWIALIVPAAWVSSSRFLGLRKGLVRALAVATCLSFVLSSLSASVLLTDDVQESGPLVWELLSKSGLVLSLAVLALWAFVPARTSRRVGTSDDPVLELTPQGVRSADS